MLTKEQAQALAEALYVGTWSDWVALEDGSRVRAKLEGDDQHSLDDDGDWFGSFHWPKGNERPSACDGAALKIQTRNGPLWWQPPEDVKDDHTALASLEKRVRAYVRGEWSYVGVVLEHQTAPCASCGERKSHTSSLWGIESDAGDYFAEVLSDLSSEGVTA